MSQGIVDMWTEWGRTCEGQCGRKWTWSKPYTSKPYTVRCPPQNKCFSAKNVVHDPSWPIAKPRNKHMDHHPKEHFHRGWMEKACSLHKTCTLVSTSACLHGCMVACLYRCMPALYLSTDLPIYIFVMSICHYLPKSIHLSPDLSAIYAQMLGITCTLKQQ